MDRLVDHERGLVEHRGQLLGGSSTQPSAEVPGPAAEDEFLVRLRRRVVDDRGERVVLDVDEIDGVLGDVAIVRDDERDEVADEADLVLGERRARAVGHVLAGEREPRLVDTGIQISRGEDRMHAVEFERRGGVDAHDPCSGERAAHETGVEHAGPHDVVDIGAVAGEQPRILDAGDARAGVPRRTRCEIGVRHVLASVSGRSSSHQGIIFITIPSGSWTNSR